MNDIQDLEDIKLLVNKFYAKITEDQKIGFLFTEIARVDLPSHLPKMYSFWETVLFGKASFKGNPMLKHFILNNRYPLTRQHFSRWTDIWEGTVNEHYAGKKAQLAINRAKSISEIMQIKMNL